MPICISPILFLERFSSHQQSREHKLLVLLLLAGIEFLSLLLILHSSFPLVACALSRGEIVFLNIM